MQTYVVCSENCEEILVQLFTERSLREFLSFFLLDSRLQLTYSCLARILFSSLAQHTIFEIFSVDSSVNSGYREESKHFEIQSVIRSEFFCLSFALKYENFTFVGSDVYSAIKLISVWIFNFSHVYLIWCILALIQNIFHVWRNQKKKKIVWPVDDWIHFTTFELEKRIFKNKNFKM